jgi:hypothetical protein
MEITLSYIIQKTMTEWLDGWGYDDNFSCIARFCDDLMENYCMAKLEQEAKEKKGGQAAKTH